jgi:DHA2 family multidrug resistance protein-like MFS transporter
LPAADDWRLGVGVASVFAAFSSSAEMLIAARALLGFAAATLAPSTLSLIRTMFLDPKQRTFAIGVWIASFSAGGAIGPLIGGILLAHLWWGSVFLVVVPVMLLLLVLGPILLPKFRNPQARRLDLFSAGTSLAAVLAVIYGIKRIAEYGATWPSTLAILAGLVIRALFLQRQRKLTDLVIDLRLFRADGFSAALAINILWMFIAFGSFLFIAQYLQLVLGIGPLEAGLWTAPSGVAFVAGSMLAPLLVRHVYPAYVMAGCFALTALGFSLLVEVGESHGLWILVTGFVLYSLGLASIATLTTDLAVGVAPPEQAGAASGISETSFEFGRALGIAVLGSIVTVIYRSTMGDAIPGGVPTVASETARGTLGGAAAVVQHLPGQLGADLLRAARGFHAVVRADGRHLRRRRYRRGHLGCGPAPTRTCRLRARSPTGLLARSRHTLSNRRVS